MSAAHPDLCDLTFKRQVVIQCCDALEREGFTRFRKEKVDWPLGEEFHCWVGLNSSLSPEFVHISPFVGLHVKPIEKLWTSYKVGKYTTKYDRAVATYARHFGEISPSESEFKFTRATDIESESRRLARLYATVGFEFAKAIADYQSLLPLLKARIGMLGAYPERVACCLYLMGRKSESRKFVKEFVSAHHDYFAGFANPFLKRLDEEGLT